MTTAWRAESLRYGYSAGRPALAGVDLAVEPGELVAILGPNGSGKSTLLRLLAGLRRPDAGRALLFGTDAAAWEPAARARRAALLPQREEPAFPISVGELVAMGRYARLGAWRRPGPADRAAIGAALDRCRVADLVARDVATLSGGERQRARLARALAQEPDALALDEPTAALDLAHEMEIWRLLAGEARAGRAVLVATHHVNLAARYADRLVLLDAGRVVAAGTPAEVLTVPALERVYGWPVRIVPHPGPGSDAGAPQVVPLDGGSAPPSALHPFTEEHP